MIDLHCKFITMLIVAIPTGALVYWYADGRVLMLLGRDYNSLLSPPGPCQCQATRQISSDPLHPCHSNVTTVEFCHRLSPCRWKTSLFPQRMQSSWMESSLFLRL